MNLGSLHKTYTRFVTNGLGPNADPEILRRVKVINLAGSAMLMAGIFWVLADIFVLGRVGPSFMLRIMA